MLQINRDQKLIKSEVRLLNYIGKVRFFLYIGFHIISMRMVMAILFFVAIISNVLGQETLRSGSLPMISAHRGASDLAPENTLLAFSKAIEIGTDFVEIDVRTTQDGVQVIVHDASLKRTTGLDKETSNISLEKIKELSAGSWFGMEYQNQKIPTLEEVCELVRSENRKRDKPVNLYVDCKAIKADEVVRILKLYDLMSAAVFYGDVTVLNQIRKLYGKARIVPAYADTGKGKEELIELAPYAVDISPKQLNNESVSFCHANGIKVFVDLLDQYDIPDEYRKAIQLKVDLIQTDHITNLLQVVQEFRN